MPGRFNGLTDLQWKIIEPLIPDPFIGYVGRPHAPFKEVLNTIIWVLMSGARWADIPGGRVCQTFNSPQMAGNLVR